MAREEDSVATVSLTNAGTSDPALSKSIQGVGGWIAREIEALAVDAVAVRSR